MLLLGYPDSNQERQDQNLQCYHYTIAQSMACQGRGMCRMRSSLFASAKVRPFCDMTKHFREKKQKKMPN